MGNYLDVLASPNRPKIGLVLSSGGIRPFGAVELFNFLEEAHIPLDLIIGCSGGAFVGGLKAMGLKTSEMKETIKNMLQPEVYTDINYRTIAAGLHLPFFKFNPKDALLFPDKPLAILRDIFGDELLQNTSTKFFVQSTDMESGCGVVLSKGLLREVIYASCAMVPFFPPIKIDNRWLVDGGFSTLLPVMEAVSRHVDIIICMDFNASTDYHPVTMFDYFIQSLNECQRDSSHWQNSLAIDVHHYEIIFIEVAFPTEVNMMNFHTMQKVYEHTYLAIEKIKEIIINTIESFPQR